MTCLVGRVGIPTVGADHGDVALGEAFPSQSGNDLLGVTLRTEDTDHDLMFGHVAPPFRAQHAAIPPASRAEEPGLGCHGGARLCRGLGLRFRGLDDDMQPKPTPCGPRRGRTNGRSGKSTVPHPPAALRSPYIFEACRRLYAGADVASTLNAMHRTVMATT